MPSIINSNTSSGLVTSGSTDGVLQLQTASTTAVTIDASQNVGVGTSSFTAKLTVKPTANTYTGGALALVGASSGTSYLTSIGGSLYVSNDGSTDHLILNSSGNLGLGVTPSAWVSGWKAIELGGTVSNISSANQYMNIFSNAYRNASSQYIYTTTGAATVYAQATGQHQWYNAPSGTAGTAITLTQAMTLDASGNLMLGQTTPSNTVYGSFQNQTGQLSLITKTGNSQCLFLNRQDDTGTAILFRQANGTTGSITVTTNTTAYNTSSDYRLKNTIATMTGGLAKVSQLKPVTYKWNNDNSDGEGFIAHELAEVCPHAVYGTKDEVDSEGNPVYQGIDTSFLVATLTASIQELHEMVKAQSERIAVLEAK